MEREISEVIKNSNLQEGKKKYYAVMLFNTELELGISNKPNKWVNTGLVAFDNGTEALEFYANTPNPASVIVDAPTIEELNTACIDMLHNYQNEKWLEENLYPNL